MCFEEFYFFSIQFLFLKVGFEISIIDKTQQARSSNVGGRRVAPRSSRGKDTFKSHISRTRIK